MAITVPHLFYHTVVSAISITLFVVTMTTEIVAFFHCLFQRAPGFIAIGTLSKSVWLAMIGGSTLFVLLLAGTGASAINGMLSLIPIAVALVYLLDIRPALRDGGRGPW
jgi:hypothetical protein